MNRIKPLPLIIILGATGTGKTKLSLELAQKFNGEIISADSMQVYKEFNILTAKATKDEQIKSKHHLLDVATTKLPYDVKQFRDAALPIIDNCLSNSKIPIIVGGTNYYIESLLWKILINSPSCDVKNNKDLLNTANSGQYAKIISNSEQLSIDNIQQEHDTEQSRKRTYSEVNIEYISNTKKNVDKSLCEDDLNKYSNKTLYDMLVEIDSKSADRIHPNNRRKIIRALEIFRDHGKTLTKVLNEQKTEEGSNKYGGPLRYKNAILLWVKCDESILKERLDNRISEMLKLGLLKEIREFYNNYLKDCQSENVITDTTKGILQSIGFKEFLPYLENNNEDTDELIVKYIVKNQEIDATDVPKELPMLLECLERLKLVTKRYAKKQIKWITNRFTLQSNRLVPSIYVLNSSDIKNWNKNVYLPAENIINSYMENIMPKLTPLSTQDNPRKEYDENLQFKCEYCQRVFVGEFQWNIHNKSNRHKRVITSFNRKRLNASDCSEKRIKEVLV